MAVYNNTSATTDTIMSKLFKQALGLKWRVTEHSSHQAQLSHSFDENMIRQTSLVPAFDAKAVWLGHVPAHEAVYTAASSNLAYAAFARIGLGKVGYVGDVNFGEEPERLIIAMCHLDREEDRFEASLDAI